MEAQQACQRLEWADALGRGPLPGARVRGPPGASLLASASVKRFSPLPSKALAQEGFPVGED